MREEIELMRVVRVPPLGRLVIEVGNERYEKITEIEDERLKRRVITAIGELMGLAGGYQTLVDEGVAPALAVQTPSGSLQQKAAALKEQQERFLESLEQEKETIIRQAKGTGREERPPVQEPVSEEPLSIVEQIDAILQKHKNANPAFNGRSIHLIQGSDGNVKIEVDGQIYDRPKDINDRDIQITIKQALKEWEST